jgi:hypothetical protein
MPLVERYHLSQEEAEARLKRALTGDPTRGEIGLLDALRANRLDDVQSRLARDATLGADTPRPRRRAPPESPRALGDLEVACRAEAARVGHLAAAPHEPRPTERPMGRSVGLSETLGKAMPSVHGSPAAGNRESSKALDAKHLDWNFVGRVTS